MRRAILSLIVLAAFSSVRGEMVSARWGVKGRLQHAGALTYRTVNKDQLVLAFDVSALPKGATVCRARLFFAGTDWKDRSFDIVPAAGADAVEPVAGGKPLELVGPHFAWFDATEAARAWAAGGAKVGRLWLRAAPKFDRDATVLEIAWQGKAGKPPRQVSDVAAVHRNGQVFITFKEIDPPDGGKDEITWDELTKAGFKRGYYGPTPDDAERRLRYRVYEHAEPITPATIGEATLVGEVPNGSAINTRYALLVDPKKKSESLSTRLSGEALVLRVAVESGKQAPAGTGLYVHTVAGKGTRYYAVCTAVDGAVNAVDVGRANTAGPVDVAAAEPEPILFKEIVVGVSGGKHHEQWYDYWTVPPQSRLPSRYEVLVWLCPEKMARPASLHVSRDGWNSYPRPPRPGATTGIGMEHTADQPVEFRTGLNDAMGTLKGFDKGVWRPFHTHREYALIEWMKRTWPIDPNRISINVSAWGMLEAKRGDLFSYLRGWGEPELTKGFQCWDRARGIWGPPEMYAGRADEANPYVANNITDWALADPTVEMPFIMVEARGGSHFTEMGWPPFPRFFWAMMETKRPFAFNNSRAPISGEIARLAARRDRSMPAFANGTLDDNVGEGSLGSGDGWNNAQINGYLLWDPETITDLPDRWEMTVWVDDSAPRDACTVNLTPRRCQKFAAKAGAKFAWTNGLLPPEPPAEAKAEGDDQPAAPKKQPPPKLVQKGAATADEHGFVTIEDLKLTKGRHRVVLTPGR